MFPSEHSACPKAWIIFLFVKHRDYACPCGQMEWVDRKHTKPRPADQRLPSARMNREHSPEEIKEHFLCILSTSTSQGIRNLITCIKHGVFLFAVFKECNFTTISFYSLHEFSHGSSVVLENSWGWLGNRMINKKTLNVLGFFKTCLVSKSILSHCKQKEKKCP